MLFRIALPVFNRTDIWLMFIFAFLFNASQIFWSFQIDILNPKLSDYASTGSITDNDNIKKALGNGFLVSIAFTLLSIFVFLFFESIAWILLIIMMFIWLGFRFLSFNTYLKAYFVDIEY